MIGLKFGFGPLRGGSVTIGGSVSTVIECGDKISCGISATDGNRIRNTIIDVIVIIDSVVNAHSPIRGLRRMFGLQTNVSCRGFVI
jgi:hypothetical protein